MQKTYKKHTFSFQYLEESFNNSTYLLPMYALRRPACTKILVNREYYEPETHRLIALIFENLSGSMLHAGTFFGDMIPTFSMAVSGVLWCFEPVIENYILANKCIEENNLENVFLLNVALSNKVGMVKVNTSVSNKKNKGGISPQEIGTVATYQGHRGGGSYVDGIGQPTPSITIDNFQYDSLIVIQLDVEGHELIVLKGATDTISKHLPIIMVEDNNKECSKFLENRGYSFFASIPGLKIWVNNQNTMIASVMEKLKKNMA